MALSFSSKAGTLALLQNLIESARIAPLVRFTVAEWQADRASCCAQVHANFVDGPWIVRSSCHQEDGDDESNAGTFLSIRDVAEAELESAVYKHVFHLYWERKAHLRV